MISIFVKAIYGEIMHESGLKKSMDSYRLVSLCTGSRSRGSRGRSEEVSEKCARSFSADS